MDFVTILLAVIAAGLVGFEVGRYVAVQKMQQILRQMTEDLVQKTKQIQESKGGTAG